MQYHVEFYGKDDSNENTTDSEDFKYEARMIERTPVSGSTKDVELVVPLKYLSNF